MNEAAAKEAAVKEADGAEAAPASILEAQINALLGLVAQRREQRTRDIRSTSDAQMREILQAAHAEARDSLHQAVERERARMAQGLRQAEARAELETRQRAQRETLALLQHMWQCVGATLEARWRVEQERGAWVAAAVQEVAWLLGGRPWRIEHGAELTRAEQQRALAQTGAGSAQDVEWHLEPQIRAGLRVRTSGACLDATIEGLLADREGVEALFLSEYLASGPKP